MKKTENSRPMRKISVPALCCEYIHKRGGVMTECGYRANYRKTWHYCPYCGRPIAKLFNDELMKEE